MGREQGFVGEWGGQGRSPFFPNLGRNRAQEKRRAVIVLEGHRNVSVSDDGFEVEFAGPVDGSRRFGWI